jgi:hypothetical protein
VLAAVQAQDAGAGGGFRNRVRLRSERPIHLGASDMGGSAKRAGGCIRVDYPPGLLDLIPAMRSISGREPSSATRCM